MVRHRLAALFEVNTNDDELRRRGQHIIIIGLGLLASALLGQLSIFFFDGASPFFFVLIGIELIHCTAIALAKRAFITAAATIQLAFSLITSLASYGANGGAINAAFMVFVIVLASVTMRSIYIWPVIAIGSISIAAVSPYVQGEQLDSSSLYTIILLYGLVGLIAYLGARSSERAYAQLLASRSEAEHAAQQLAVTNSSLEQRVAERTAALKEALTTVTARTSDLQAALAENAQQREVIRALGVPVLPLTHGTLVLPLVGELDAVRLQQVQEQTLRAIEQQAARRAILDITGVPVVDNQVAQGLMRVVEAARLLGAQVTLVGIRPEVAQSIVGLGLDLRNLHTFADLQSALEGAEKIR